MSEQGILPSCTCGSPSVLGVAHRAGGLPCYCPDPVVGGNTGEPLGMLGSAAAQVRAPDVEVGYRDRVKAVDDALRLTLGNEDYSAHDTIVLAHYLLTGRPLLH